MQFSQDTLKQFQPQHECFVGIDSDGCVFDSMEIKHKECFTPAIIKEFKLQAISKYVREAEEFVNLYSRWRGVNRFPGLVKAFDLLRERPEVQRRGVAIPELPDLRSFIDSGKPLGNPALEAEVAANGSAELQVVLRWSHAVNARIADMVEGVPPFPYFRDSAEKISRSADIIVVSSTPGEALVREWQEHGIDKYAAIIAGQEMGNKKEHLGLAAAPHYPADRILMIGDAPGDMKAGQAHGARFFPVVPGAEEESWQRLHDEAFDRFLNGTYKGDYEDTLIAEFEAHLPETPPWNR